MPRCTRDVLVSNGEHRLNSGLASANRCGQRSIKLPSNCLFTVEAIWSSFPRNNSNRHLLVFLESGENLRFVTQSPFVIQEDRGFRSWIPCLISCFVVSWDTLAINVKPVLKKVNYRIILTPRMRFQVLTVI